MIALVYKEVRKIVKLTKKLFNVSTCSLSINYYLSDNNLTRHQFGTYRPLRPRARLLRVLGTSSKL